MHCFACNFSLTNPQLDKPTGRYYCDSCMEPTVEIQLKLAGKDYYDFTDISETLEEVPLIEAKNSENTYDEEQ